MKWLSVLIISLLLGNVLSAQNIIFNWQSCLLGYETIEEYSVEPKSIVKTSDGFLMVATYEVPPTEPPPVTSSYDIWLVKLDNNGNFVWDKFFGGSKSDGAALIVASTDGYYYIIGGSASSDGDIGYDPYPNSFDYWVIKIDETGNIIWEKIVGGNSGEYFYNTAAYADADGGIIYIGTTLSTDGDITQNYGTYDMWMVKINTDGIKAWDFTAGTPDFEYGSAMIHTSDNGYLLGGDGTPVSGGNIDCISPSSTKPEAIIIKLDTNRNIEWQQCIGGSGYDGVSELIKTPDGFLIGLYTTSDDRDLSGVGYHIGYDNLGNRTSDMWLRRTDHAGNMLWQKCYGGSRDEFAHKLFNLSDGNFMVFASSNSLDGDVNGLHHFPDHPEYTYTDIWMLKINGLNGEIIWQRCIGARNDEDVTEGIIQLSDKDYIITSETQFGMMDDITCGPFPSNKHWAWIISVTDTNTYTGITEYQDMSKIINLYPNPASDYIALEIPKHLITKNTIAEIINSEGITVKKIELSSYTPFLQISDLPAGLYHLKIDNQKMKSSKRFIKK
jgi:hypothetical protein